MLHFFAKRIRDIQEAKRDERGFTLIELLVVVIIIGILAAIAIPTFLNQRQKAQDADAVSAARNAATIVNSIAVDCNGRYANNPPTCTTAITGANVTAAEASLSSYNPTVTVTGANQDAFTVAVASKSGKTATFSSATGKVVVT